MDILLETERLRLRRFTTADAEQLYHLDNDPEVMRFINGGTPASREIIEHEMLPVFLRYAENLPGYGFWAVIEKGSDTFLGWLCFRPVADSLTEVSLGYRLHQAAWGKGYATEGARALIRKGFSEWAVQRVVATTYEHNLASRRVMEKLGMTLLRRFRMTPEDLASGDTYHLTSVELWDGDDVEYALDRKTWQQQQELRNEL